MENKNNLAKEDMEKAIKARKFETEGKLKEQQDQQQNMRRYNDTYKMHLINKLTEKGNRAYQISCAKEKLQKTAFKNSTLDFARAMHGENTL